VRAPPSRGWTGSRGRQGPVLSSSREQAGAPPHSHPWALCAPIPSPSSSPPYPCPPLLCPHLTTPALPLSASASHLLRSAALFSQVLVNLVCHCRSLHSPCSGPLCARGPVAASEERPSMAPRGHPPQHPGRGAPTAAAGRTRRSGAGSPRPRQAEASGGGRGVWGGVLGAHPAGGRAPDPGHPPARRRTARCCWALWDPRLPAVLQLAGGVLAVEDAVDGLIPARPPPAPARPRTGPARGLGATATCGRCRLRSALLSRGCQRVDCSITGEGQGPLLGGRSTTRALHLGGGGDTSAVTDER